MASWKLSVSALLCAPLTVAASVGAAPTQLGSAQPTHLASVQVLSDRLRPLPGIVVRLDDGTRQTAGVTSSDGQTPWLAMDTAGGVEVVLTETSTAAGTAVGMIVDATPPPMTDPDDDVRFTLVSRTQPMAVPVLIEGLPGQVNDLFPPAGDYPHWRLFVPPSSPLRFSAGVASLLDEEAIDQYLSYRGHDPRFAPDYVRGVVLVVPHVRLGTSGLVVGLDLLGDLGAGLVVDAFNFVPLPAQLPGTTPLEVELLLVHDDVAYVRVSGSIQHGQLALLARSATGPPAQVSVLRDDPPVFLVPEDSGRGMDSAARDGCEACGPLETPASESAPGRPPLVTDCEPPVPQQPANWSCTPETPPGNACGPALPTASATECKVVRSRTARICRVPGAKVKASKGKTATWKVSFRIKGSLGKTLSTGGGFEYGQESVTVDTDEWQAAAGAHGKGQCMRLFRFSLVCAQSFTLMADGLGFDEFGHIHPVPCNRRKVVWSACTDLSTTQSVCDRTP